MSRPTVLEPATQPFAAGDSLEITLEADPGYAEVARENIARAGLGDAVDLRVGPA